MVTQRIRYVPQRGDGCGIACVAMLAGVTYDQAKAFFPPNSEAKGSEAKHIIEALKHFRIEAAPLKPLADDAYLSLEGDAVLRGEIKEPGENRDWHWVIWDAGRRKILDPYRPKHEFRCTSVLGIVRQSAT